MFEVHDENQLGDGLSKALKRLKNKPKKKMLVFPNSSWLGKRFVQSEEQKKQESKIITKEWITNV